MRVVFDGRWLRSTNISGLDRYCLEVLTHVLQLNSDHQLIVLTTNAHTRQILTANLPESIDGKYQIVDTQIPVFSPLEWQRLPGLVRSYQPDLFYAPNFFVYPFSPGLPTIGTVHDLVQFAGIGWRSSSWRGQIFAHKPFVKWMLGKFDQVVAISQHTQHDVHRLAPAVPTTLIYSGVGQLFWGHSSPAQIAKVKKKYQLPARYLLYVGRQDPYKNVAGLVRAYSLLPEQLRGEYGLVIAGKQHPTFYPELAKTVEELGVPVNFPGFIDDADLLALYQGASVFTFPSLYEGFGLPILEAMAAGVPVVTSGATSLSEVAGRAAVIIDAQDPRSMAAGLEEVLANPVKQQRMIETGRRWAKSFQWELTAQSVVKLWEEVGSA